MKILVTGGAGFQGSHLVDQWIEDGHQVTVLNTYSDAGRANLARAVERGCTVVWGSVTDPEIVGKTVRGQDVVVHLAARVNVDESLRDPRAFAHVNIEGTLNVLEAVRTNGNRMIYASTCEVYGASTQAVTNEEAEMRPASPYGASKAAADRLCSAYHTSFATDVTILRPCNVYGERQKAGAAKGAVIPIFAELAAAGKPLTVYGEGKQQREYIHVEDLVRAYDLVLRREDLAGRVFNVSAGESVSVLSIAHCVSERFQVPIVHQPARSGEVVGFHLDSSQIMNLGFRPQISFWTGLEAYLTGLREDSLQPERAGASADNPSVPEPAGLPSA